MDAKQHYAKLTWPEVQAASESDTVIVIPVGAIEQHGPHLPLDVDIRIASTVCAEAVAKVPGEALLFPPLSFGYESHHMDFPGTIDIRWDTFVHYGLCVTGSLAHHGFKHILLVNGHGSNRPLIAMIARLTTVRDPGVLCAALSWWELERVREAFAPLRESDMISHAGELETSAYLGIEPELVQMDKAVDDRTYRRSPHIWTDLLGQKPGPEYRQPVQMMELFSSLSETGVRGDATKATAEKGRLALDAASAELAELILEFTAREPKPGIDRHGPYVPPAGPQA